MKTFKQYITEKWFETIRTTNFGYASDFDIFINPTKSEIVKEITSDFRWCCFPKSQNMYVADSSCIHVDIARAAYKIEKSDCIYGTGYISRANQDKGNIVYDFIEEETLYPSNDRYYMDNYYMGPKMYDYDWTFMDQYIPNFNNNLQSQKDKVLKAYEEME
jgi:hypothetical protein